MMTDLAVRIERIIAWLTGVHKIYITPWGWLALASVLVIIIVAITLAAKKP